MRKPDMPPLQASDTLAHALEIAESSTEELLLVRFPTGRWAGISRMDLPTMASAHTPETLLRVMNVNLGGVVLGTRLAVPVLRRRGGGAIVNTASMAALFPLTADPIYSATKAGVTMFTRACAPLAEEGIRVNAVLPGLVDTPLLAKSGDGDRWADWAYAAQDVMGLLDADDVAAVVLDLVRDDTAVAEERIVGSIPAAQDPSS